MKQQVRLSLPIDPYLEALVKDGQKHSTLLVKASPGSGKTTRLPWAIAKSSSGKVLVLEPRRLAAKLAALRIAQEENFTPGQEVGYHFRFEKKISVQSKLIFYTEGTFLRTLIDDPQLQGVETVILDEFHERHIETDVALAALRSLQHTRGDLKIILMSATLDTKIFDFFPEAKLIEIEAPHFEVKLHFLPNQPSVLKQSLEAKIKQALLQADAESDALIFVPGMREMLRVKEYLGDELGELLLLHGDLSKEEQEMALNPSPRRKIILATNIAESSITIPGIKVVIDSGIQREAHYSPWTGLKSLVDRPITQSQAIQRAGRAGRTGPGECFRLYSQQDFNERAAHTMPEIERADLTDTYLLVSELKTGVAWFTPPPPERWQKALELCQRLGAVDSEGNLTLLGEKMRSYPLEARLARALVAGENFELSEKKKLLEYIAIELENDRSGLIRQRLQFYLKEAGKLKASWEQALLAGLVDQVAKLREKQHDLIHFSGKTLKLHGSLKDLHQEFCLVLDVTQRQEAIKIVPIEEEWLLELDPFPFSEEETLEVGEKIRVRHQTKLGSILIDEKIEQPSWADLSLSIKEKVLELGRRPFAKALAEWKESESYLKLHFWSRHKKLSLGEIEASFNIADYLNLHQQLNWNEVEAYFQETLLSALDLTGMHASLPDKINLGGRRELKVHYPLGMDPYVEAPIQDFYGQRTTPTLMRGELPLTLKLLGPHKRPIQVTKDLAGFWERTYPGLKKEWSREYPRHYWPDNPSEARPILLKRMLNE